MIRIGALARFAALILWPLLVFQPAAAQSQAVAAERHMVAAAHPLAAEAGREILRAGGSAVDAAIAAQMVLTLVEPQSSGVGGGAFLLHWRKATAQLAAFDGRETAPAAATPDQFMSPAGVMPYAEGAIGGRAVGAPGALRMLEMAHQAHGKLAWWRLFQPAIALSRDGFPVSERLAASIAANPRLRDFAAARDYFFRADGAPRQAGERLQNPELAKTLDEIARFGADRFYRGRIARAMVSAVRDASPPGRLAVIDLETYRAKQRQPVCGGYRQFKVCGMGLPSAGGISLLQILKIVEGFDLAALAPGSAAGLHLIAEASRLAYADRAIYLADSDFVAAPVRGLLDDDYLRTRRGLINSSASMGVAMAGQVPGAETWPYGGALAAEPAGTSHLSIADDAGNIVALTTTIESPFGSHLMAAGFLLNNEMNDFSWTPSLQGAPVANRVEPNKRPLSTMAPTIVFDGQDRPVLLLGSPGGGRIVNYVAKTLIAVLDWRMEPQAAVDLPNFVNRNGPTEIEALGDSAALETELRALGHDVVVRPLNSGVQMIAIDGKRLLGAADRRREGVALGD